ncbi:MAG: hypothetical protein KDD56_10140 [Bdellovibrionales bacterium]|nr:hypothetical protein [Bdellovibrionales bacterium]
MKKFKNTIKLLVIALFLTNYGYAESFTIKISEKLDFKPSKASMMLLNAENSTIVNDVELTEQDNKVFSAIANIKDIDATDIYASALFINQEGQFLMSDVVKVTGANTSSYLNINTCDPSQGLTINETMQDQVGLLESLENIRLARRDFLKNKLSEILSTEFQERLLKIETGFGLNTSGSINSETNPFEILNRLERIKNSLNSYQQAKSK